VALSVSTAAPFKTNGVALGTKMRSAIWVISGAVLGAAVETPHAWVLR